MCSKIDVVPATVNPDDQIGVQTSIVGGCAPAGSGISSLSAYIPQNGEYEWAGEGNSCYYCSFDSPNSIDCSTGCANISCCAIVGTEGTYKRKSYNADPTQCCIQGVSMIDNTTCDPKYRNPKSTSCYDALKQFCTQGDKIFTEGVCQTWCANNLDECKLLKSQICNDPARFGNGYCKDWCLQNNGLCDTSVNSFCVSDTTNDSICACLKSDLIKYKYNPVCEDKACIDNGYQTSSMLSSRGSGCQIVDCTTYFNIVAGGKVQFEDVTLQQRCGSSSGGTTTNIGGTSLIKRYGILFYTIAALLIWFIIIVVIVKLVQKRS